MRALITGGTGFIGRYLIKRLARPVVLGRDPDRIRRELGDVEASRWNARSPLDPELFTGVDTVFHLAGEPIASGRWDTEKKERIRKSRVEGTRLLVDALGRTADPPATLICASAIGYYGSRGDEILSESSPAGHDFLAGVCREWEEEAQRAEGFGVRVVSLRIGVVLGPDGGALEKMLPPFRLGLGGRLGSGRQYMSWIHRDDLVGLLLYAADNGTLRGPVNAVAPHPLTNREFTATLARVLHRPALLPVPAFILKMMLGDFADVLLGSQRVIPEKAQKAGFPFAHPRLDETLAGLVAAPA